MSTTPLRDAWKAYKDQLDTSKLFTEIAQLGKGDYVRLNSNGIDYVGKVLKIGPKNITVQSPYGGWAGNDFIEMQDIQFPKSTVVQFYKSKQ